MSLIKYNQYLLQDFLLQFFLYNIVGCGQWSNGQYQVKAVGHRVVKADFLKAVRKAVPKRLIRLLKGCYI